MTTYLLQTDMQRSTLGGQRFPGRAYSAYGDSANPVSSMQGFAGQVRDRQTGWYHLDNGHRVYNPKLMRFHSADRLSPFDKGGLNAYAYCRNDPINFHDPSGQFPSLIAPIKGIIGGFLNLAISVVKAYRGHVTERNFTINTRYPASRAGELALEIAENSVSRWTRRDAILTGVGAFSATVSIGTSIGRLAAANTDTLAWIDTGVAVVATAASMCELVMLAREPLPARYPVQARAIRRSASPARESSV